MTSENSPHERISALMRLERAVRRSETLKALAFQIVNETGTIVPSEQTFLLLPMGKKRLKMQAISNLSQVERSAPMVQWLEKTASAVYRRGESGIRRLQKDDIPEACKDDWGSYCPQNILWVPLSTFSGTSGVLLLSDARQWSDKQLVLLEHLADVYGHALALFQRNGYFTGGGSLPARVAFLAGLLLLMASLLFKIPVSANAPAEIVPEHPHLVTAPMDGVVKQVVVEPNQRIAAGELAVLLDDTDLRNQLEVAKMTLMVAQEELERTQRSAFGNLESKARVAELKAQVRRRESEMNYVRDRLLKTRLTAPSGGLVIGAPRDEWEGKPVKTGTGIIQVADPEHVHVRVLLPVADAITLEKGASIRVFLDNDPLHPLSARLEWASYSPEPTPMGFYAYRIHGRLKGDSPIPRIGLRGTATIVGPEATLFYSIFRKPITFLRQTFGW